MGSLRERKQQRAREAIIEAAHELFVERGFDDVTVTDIAERAEVGRSTFFRHFGDKQEVVFADDGSAVGMIQVSPPGPIGDSLPAAVAHARALVVTYVGTITGHPERFRAHERLVERHPELLARSLIKQRRVTEGLVERLAEDGAEPATAVLAAEIGLACYGAARSNVGIDPVRLPAAVDAAFDRVLTALR